MAARRPGMTKAEKTDVWRRYRLMQAFGAADPVVVDGVTVDLSCELDAAAWRPITVLGTYGRSEIRYGPRVIFPWTPQVWADRWRAEGEVTEAPAGSRITIAAVQDAPLQAPFSDLDHADNRARKLAYLWVLRPDGALKAAEPPLQLIAEGATNADLELENYASAYHGLVARLGTLFGCDDLETRLDGPVEGWPQPPDHLSKTYRQAALALHKALTEANEQAYMAFGYLMARGEAEELLLGPALREHANAGHRAAGSDKRSAESRKRTEPLRDHAKALIVGHPELSLSACARTISAIVAQDAQWTMGSDPNWIADHIRELFERRAGAGRLEYRPRPEWVRPT